MSKLLSLLLLIPFFAAAQTQPAVMQDFKKGIKAISTSFKVNDETNIMQINVDNKSFELLAIDKQMNTLWKTELPGYPQDAVKFQDKVFALATFKNPKANDAYNIYKGYLIDPATGKILLEKEIYEGSETYFDQCYLSYDKAHSLYRITARQTKQERRSFVQSSKQNNLTTQITVIDINDRLEPVKRFNTKVEEGLFLWAMSNSKGDLFLAWGKGKSTVSIQKYDFGQTTGSKPIETDLDLRNNIDMADLKAHLSFNVSSSNSDAVFVSALHENSNKDVQLSVIKMNFLNGAKQTVNELFNNDHIKALEKGYEPFDKKMDDPNLGSAKNLEIRYMAESGGKLVIGMSGRYTSPSSIGNGVWVNENSTLINCYNDDLKIIFQQMLPSSYAIPSRSLPIGYHIESNKLYIIANNKSGFVKLNALFGVLNLTSGKWERMEYLSKKKIDNSDYAEGYSALWFNNTCLIPYISPKGLMNNKYNISLQQNAL
ncbi:hypothetical protein ABDD95_22300 [Mucilaginibacter sp. PAMB04274]|uniref:hypothetical protein n=1 Tax=Mucilaginibacter sp. PAMB04274 TaxID=3138568 RepID=UPI0031F625BA